MLNANRISDTNVTKMCKYFVPNGTFSAHIKVDWRGKLIRIHDII